MHLQFALCNPSDIPRCFEIVSLAFGHEHGYIEALFPDHATAAGRAVGAERLAAWGTLPAARMCKVSDSDTGEILGFAKWDIYDGLARDVGRQDGPKGDYWKGKDEWEVADHMWWEFTRRRWDAVRESGGNLVSLDILVVDPKYQRKGVGNMLMKYGTDEANRLGVESVVEASKRGRFLYERHGFQILEDVLITPPAGLQGTDQFFHWMKRPAVKTAA